MEKINGNRNEKNGVTFLTFPLLERQGVFHAFSTRLGGVSQGDLASMNLSFSRGDDVECVRENHRRFAAAVGYEVRQLVLSDQIHETHVCRVDASDCGKGVVRESDLIGVDGLMTDDPGVVLMTFFADCVPLFFWDRKNRAAALSHAGWRGTVSGIGAITVERMRQEFGTEPDNLFVVVGPSIGSSCYEVSTDVAEKFFENEVLKSDPDILSQILYQKPEQKESGKFQLDLWLANKEILIHAGIPADQIEISGLCTCCHSDWLFSHRASKGRRGNLAGVISPMRAHR